MRKNRFLLALAAIALAGCSSQKIDPLPPAILPAGTPLRAILLKSLESGIDPSGTKVPALIVDSVVDKNGYVLIPSGLVTVGTVTWSRRATAFTAIANQPARLEVRFDFVELPDGTKIPITSDEDGQEGGAFGFTRTNVTRQQDVPDLEGKLSEEQKAALLKLQDTFTDTKTKPVLTAKDFATIEELAPLFNLKELKELKQESSLGVSDLVGLLASGASVTTGVGTVAAATQLLGIVGEAGRTLSGIFKGPNVRVYVGTQIVLRLAQEIQIKRDEAKRQAPDPKSKI